jgi:FAD/FMN-containing dehydrogenase
MVAPSPEKALSAALRAALETRLIDDAVIAASEAQAEALWRLRDSISEGERKDGPAAKHDLSVQVADMPAFMTEAANAVEKRFAGSRVIAFGHLGDGNVHFNVRAPEGAGREWVETEAPCVTAFVHDLTVAAGGSISAEHGIGQMRLAELARLSDPTRLGAMRAIKAALDPAGIMNPGKLVPPFAKAQDMLA